MFFQRVLLLNRAPTSSQLHLPPPSLYKPPPSSFQSPPSFLQHPQQYLNQNIACNFPKFRTKNQNLPTLTENWSTWNIGGVGSESRLRYLKFRPQNLFLGKFWNQKFKVVRFVWKLVHIVSQGCWFWFQT